MKERIHSCTKKKEEMIMGRKRFKKLTALTLAVAMVFTMNGMSTLSSSAKVKAKKKAALNKTSLSLKVGQTKKLTVKNKPAKAKLKWSTSNKKVATVKNGKVKAVKKASWQPRRWEAKVLLARYVPPMVTPSAATERGKRPSTYRGAAARFTSASARAIISSSWGSLAAPPK